MADPKEDDWFEIEGTCDVCGKQTRVVPAEDPFVKEGIYEDDGQGPRFWCRECLETRAGDV